MSPIINVADETQNYYQRQNIEQKTFVHNPYEVLLSEDEMRPLWRVINNTSLKPGNVERIAEEIVSMLLPYIHLKVQSVRNGNSICDVMQWVCTALQMKVLAKPDPFAVYSKLVESICNLLCDRGNKTCAHKLYRVAIEQAWQSCLSQLTDLELCRAGQHDDSQLLEKLTRASGYFNSLCSFEKELAKKFNGSDKFPGIFVKYQKKKKFVGGVDSSNLRRENDTSGQEIVAAANAFAS